MANFVVKTTSDNGFQPVLLEEQVMDMNVSVLKSFWHVISNRHVEDYMDKFQVIRIQLMNQYASLISFIFMLDAVRNLFIGRPVNFIILIAAGCLLFIFSQYTKIYFNVNIAVSVLTGTTLMVFYSCATTGFYNGIVLYYFAILFAGLFIFSEKVAPYNIFIFIWIFMMFCLVQLFGKQLFGDVFEKEGYFHRDQWTIFMQVVLLLAVNGYFVMRINIEMKKLYLQALRRNGSEWATAKVSISRNDTPSVADVVKLAKEDNIAFVLAFRQVFPDFYNNLLRENLHMTKEDFKFCALLKLGFTTKDIANCNHMAVRSVQTKKSRLRKAFSVPPDEDLYTWIDRF